MDTLWLEYGWTLLILIGLEGILSADNALVLAVIAKHLPDNQKDRAINYGIIGAFIFRFSALFVISFLVNVWQVQALGAIYLIYLGINNVISNYSGSTKKKKASFVNGFWSTVGKIGIADLAFAIDSILAAVALAMTLPDTPLPQFGGMDGGKFAIVIIAGIAGLVLIKFAANWFVTLLDKRPGLETAAYLIVGWVGVKLAIITLAHPGVNIIPEDFPHSIEWKIIFWGFLIAIAVFGWIWSGRKADSKRI
ncbi:TerC family protein [Lentibacillus sp. L22]|uniref:TerC family protein n=1 Tax=Lentibacillus TaxID=175304 RepID=UPI0022B12E06|nr:TerC family protein [Lentibacillus daqui]